MPAVVRPHLVLVPAFAVRPLVRLPSRRVLAAAAGAVAVLGLFYLGARETPLFAVRELEISGAPPAVRTEVEKAAERYVGESLVELDGDELLRRLAALPTVRSLRYDRAFPHTLRLMVAPEVPAAIVRTGSDSWLVSERGRVIGLLEQGVGDRLSAIWLGGRVALAVGGVLRDRQARLALGALVQVPEDFPVSIRSARARAGEITLVTGSGAELRLGDRSALPLKLAVAARVLRRLTAAERATLAYLDLTVPDHPVGADKPQVST